jgi:hypothetical protein
MQSKHALFVLVRDLAMAVYRPSGADPCKEASGLAYHSRYSYRATA